MSDTACKYVLIRTINAGVFAGYLASDEDVHVVLSGARRIWSWSGANTLSDLANYGSKKPKECKVSAPVARIHPFGVIEIIDVTEKGIESFQKSIPAWVS